MPLIIINPDGSSSEELIEAPPKEEIPTDEELESYFYELPRLQIVETS